MKLQDFKTHNFFHKTILTKSFYFHLTLIKIILPKSILSLYYKENQFDPSSILTTLIERRASIFSVSILSVQEAAKQWHCTVLHMWKKQTEEI